jgi:hypothetical protein
VTRKLTWKFGVRDTFNSNPLNPHEQIARLGGSFSSISHDVNQPLNAFTLGMKAGLVERTETDPAERLYGAATPITAAKR